MKKLVLSFVVILLMSNISILGQDKAKDEVKIKIEKVGDENRPLSLDGVNVSNNIDASWLNGVLSIDFEESEGLGFLMLEGFSGWRMNLRVDTSVPIRIYMEDQVEPVLIRIQTSMGNEYEGILIL